MQQQEDVADIEALDQVLEPLSYGFRRAGDDITTVNEVLPGQLRIFRAAILVQRPGLDGFDRALARRIGKAREHVQAAIVEVERVLGIKPLGFRIGFGHEHGLREAGPIR